MTDNLEFIPINQLEINELNANEMSEAAYEKLKRNILRSGKYPALIVRKLTNGRYRIVDGAHRYLILKELKYIDARCDVWDIDDKQETLLLTTLNRVRGTDDTMKRARLLNELQSEFGTESVMSLIPESTRAMDSLLKSLKNEGDFDLETEKGLLEEKLMQVGVDEDTAGRMVNNYQPKAMAVSLLKFVFKDIRDYNRAVEYFGQKPDTKLLIELLDEHEQKGKTQGVGSET